MDFNPRLLRADEIEVRVGGVNAGGVSLMLYKDARCDQNILDETVTPMNWQRTHSRDNKNCTVSIFDSDKNQWVSKEDTGIEGKGVDGAVEKGLASDSFKRACFNWGIGRELYSVKKLNLFIRKDNLKGYSFEGNKGKCSDQFRVSDIKYSDEKSRQIVSVTIDVLWYGTKTYSQTFALPNYNAVASVNTAQVKKEAAKPTVAASQTSAGSQNRQNTQAPQVEAKPAAPVAPSHPANGIGDDEVILIGNCRGRKYGEVKDTEVFKSFLNWAKKTESKYNDSAQADQLRRFKLLA